MSHRALLRDSINRLCSIRQACGKNDENEQLIVRSGNAFQDKIQFFKRELKQVKNLIEERNANSKQTVRDHECIEESHEINKSLRQLDKNLMEIKESVDKSEKKVRDANKKKQKPDKIRLLEHEYKERENLYKSCVDSLNAIKEYNNSEQLLKTKKKQDPAPKVLTQQLTIREQLLKSVYSRSKNAQSSDVVNIETSVSECNDEREYAEQKKVLDEQEKKINAGLDRLSRGVNRLLESAEQIGTELDVQNKMLDDTDNKVDKQIKQIKQLNRRLKRLNGNSKPLNVFINVGCFLFLIAIIGYLLYSFDVI